MFSKVVALFFLTLFAITASALPHPQGGVTAQCNTGNTQCCNTLQNAQSTAVQTLVGVLGIPIQDVTGQVGLGCTPVTIIGGTQGANCAQQPVCCNSNNFNGLLNVNCNPISV